ncbi:membrane protein [Methylobacterium nodulans]|uniref:Putative outer membrane protein B n=1 Tax=Methylobacterium nodulans (strain LMG 21967 / CNCM I-2342 / ORS 2060) TaxID=460265 RepID=B8IAT4_METNO|nr:membrane protein [Methylobacterium nodulans]ACL61129.1 putative outer membrane protein B [Methylobacterium nodulans ORS 2060]
MKFPALIAVAGLLLVAAIGHSTDVLAQATRTWVSGVGDDVNPCSRTAPCKTFAGAISKTASGGIINVLDPGGYGAVTITKPITIRSVGVEAGVLAPNTNGIVVNAPGAQVALIGLTVDGAGNGINGINIISAGQTTIENCIISGFSNAGVRLSSSAYSRATIRDSSIIANGVGVAVAPTGGVSNGIVIDDVLVDSNTTNISIDQSVGIAVIRRSTVLGSPIVVTNGGVLRSFGDNAINGGAPTATVPLQ